MRCDQCKFWGDKSDTWETGEIGFRTCLAVKERWIIADGAHEGIKHPQFDRDDVESYRRWARERSDALREARAFVEDGSEYRAVLNTGPDFFCALFLQK